MSNTLSLICHPMKLKLWVGQQSKDSLHLYGNDEAHEKLAAFLWHTKFQPIELNIDGCDDDVLHYEEFKASP